MIRFGLIGAGGVGRKRALALLPGQLAVVYDLDPARAAEVVREAGGGEVATSIDQLLSRSEIDAVLVCTPHDKLAPLTLRAMEAGKHVLVEKPGARRATELVPVLTAAVASRLCVRVGYNHRFHPALLETRRIVDSGALGPLMFLRGRYGHGGRLGYEKEWRAQPEISGGGELIDQGVHLVDLARWFLGDFTRVHGTVLTSFWDMPVEDNAFVELGNASGQIAWLHASCTEWKNLFSLEIHGREGKLQIDGLGGSYGAERLTHHRMLPQMGPPKTQVFDFPGTDNSWRRELQAFQHDIAHGTTSCATLQDALAVLRIVQVVYSQNGSAQRPEI